MIVKIFIAQGQRIQPLAQQAQSIKFNTGLTAGVIQHACNCLTQPQCTIGLTQQQYASIGGDATTLEIGLNNTSLQAGNLNDSWIHSVTGKTSSIST